MKKVSVLEKDFKLDSLYALFKRGSEKYGDKALYRFNQNKTTETQVSYNEMFELITKMTLAFQKLNVEGKKVLLLGETSVQWIASYISVVTANGIIVPLDPLLLEDEIIKFSEKTEAEIVIYSKNFSKLFTERNGEFTTVKRFIAMDKESFTLYPDHPYVDEDFTTFNNILALGNYLKDNTDMSVQECGRDVKKLSILLFTSGTTGSSKGVMLCERNICAVMEGIYPVLYHITDDDVLLSVLPIYHTYEMSAGILAPMLYGCTIAISDGIKYVGKNIKQFKPTVMMLVPLFANQLYKTIQKSVQKQGKEKTLKKGIKISNFLLKLHIDMRRKLFSQVLEGLGGNISKFIVGGAALNPAMVDSFKDLGIHISQGYGITECSPLISVVPLNEYNPTSCGKLMPGMQIYIDKETPDAEFGEIVVKGDNVMLGYYKDPEETAKVLSEDGWFRTGDYGYVDNKGYIYITGRKKNVIVLQGGKNVFPEEIEEYLERVNLIGEVVVMGREDKETGVVSVVALVYPDAEECKAAGLEGEEAIYNAINNEIQNINKMLASYKHVNKLELRSEPFEKTTSRKIKRHTIK
ncbi:MAG: AMP-binding protein [Clostridia bacterium]|nr:AMP-binding protein [Clostridia bacterium]